MTPQHLPALLERASKKNGQKKALFFKSGGQSFSVSWEEFYEQKNRLSAGLAANGLKSGDRVAIFSENRPEWALTDLAALSLGAVTVPIYATLASAEIQYILEDSQSSVLAVSGKALLEKILPIQKNLPNLKFIIIFDASLALMKEHFSIPLLLIKDLEKLADASQCIGETVSTLGPDTLATIIYTSGTTGPPKGVMLTHGNFLANVIACEKAFKIHESDRHLSFLPLCHVFERMAGYYLMLHTGASIVYAESMETVPVNMLEAKPTFLLGVPRFYEKIKDKVLEAVKTASPAKRGLFYWAKSLGEKKRLARSHGKSLGPLFWMEIFFAERLVYRKFKQRLGGNVRFCVSGGAPLAREVAEFFYDMGVLILEGYGLTETSPVIAVNLEQKFKFGTVGPVLNGVEVQITPEGEISTRSACVMKGYWNKKEETESVLKQGWFHTGDLGLIDKDGFLTITGRKKELIVTSGGKKVVPRVVEESVESDPYILRCVLFGEGKNYLTALLVPDKEKLLAYAQGEKIAFTTYESLLKNPAIYRFIESHVEECSKNLANYEKIKYFILLENDFSQSSGELTPTLKIKRDVVISRHKEALLALYSHGS